MFNSADDETLKFSSRFRQRYGKNPSWPAVQGYDSARLAIAAARFAVAQAPAADIKARRKAVCDFLASLNSPANAIDGVTGPLWFTPGRGRVQTVRVGRFQDKLFGSAPLQLVPVSKPERIEDLVEIGDGRYARRQQVVYTGLFLNELPRVDIAASAFTADFYFWLRFVPIERAGAIGDPADISFPDLVRGSFDPKQPVADRALADGSVYRLWRMRGEFKNDFDLHHYPLDRQRLLVRLFNAKAASDRVVYVQDRRVFQAPGDAIASAKASPERGMGSALAGEAKAPQSPTQLSAEAAPDAFRNLTQWEPVQIEERRDNLVTLSALGDPMLVGFERKRKLSGFSLVVDLKRYLLATLAKTLLPLGMMTLIMFASLFFPTGLVKEKVTVAIAGALSGAVLLASVNSQLGTVGYTMAVEYVFYIFFALCLFCILSVLLAERFRAAHHMEIATRTDLAARALFSLTVVATAVAAGMAAARW